VSLGDVHVVCVSLQCPEN